MPVASIVVTVTNRSQQVREWRRSERTLRLLSLVLIVSGMVAGLLPALVAPAPAAASHGAIKFPFAAGADWWISQGYHTSPAEGWSHYNCDPQTGKDEISQTERCQAGWQYKYSFDLRRVDGSEAGQPVLSPVDGVIRWIDTAYGGMSIDLGDGYAVAFYHADLVGGVEAGQTVRLGQKLGTVSGPGGGGNGGTPHIHLTLWRTEDGGNWSRMAVPFTDEHPIDGYDFPFLGEREHNQHWNSVVVSSNELTGRNDTPAASTTAPATPMPTGPADGTLFASAAEMPLLTWDASADALEYQVVLNDGERTSPWLTETTWATGTLPNGSYRWQVRARNELGESSLSNPLTFTVELPDETARQQRREAEADATPVDGAQSTPTAYTAEMNIAAAEAVVGTRLTINGAGYQAGEQVRLYWDRDRGEPIGEATANESGAWTTALTVPAAPGGAHTIVARGDRGGQADGAFQVAASLTRDPVTVAPGGSVALGLAGFGASETVTVAWQGDGGPSLGTVTTDPTGGAALNVTVPADAAGVQEVVALGATSGGRAVASLRVETNDGRGGMGEIVAGGSMLGPGTFQVTTTVEGLIGGTTASGHTIQPDDRFASLPACTTTSCPWLEPGVADPLFGTRIECGDTCFVKVVNPANDRCAVVPVLEVGPWYTLDDWWNPAETRILNTLPTTVQRLAQGYTGADAATDGLDTGFGRSPDGIGLSNKGYAVGNRAAMDLATGTWADLGFDPMSGIETVVVSMLWQTGESPDQAGSGCVGAEATPVGGDDPATPETADAAQAATPEAAVASTAVPDVSGETAATPVAETAPTATETPTAETEATAEMTDESTAEASGETTDEAADEPVAESDSEPAPESREERARAKGNRMRERHGLEPVPVLSGNADEPATGVGGPGADALQTYLETTGEPAPEGIEEIVESAQDASMSPEEDNSSASEAAPDDVAPPADDAGAAPDGAPAGEESANEADGVPLDAAPEETAPPTGDEAPAADTTVPDATAAEPAVASETEAPVDPAADPNVAGEVGPTETTVAEPVVAPVAAPVTREVTLLPVADTSVMAAAPSAVQAPEQSGQLPVGGSVGSLSYLTFEVTGVAAGTVVDARLVLTGIGDTSGSGGAIAVLPGVIVDETAPYQAQPAASAPSISASGATIGADWLQPGVETSVDVTGTVSGDGLVTFVIFGAPEAMPAFGSRESGVPPRLHLTVQDPANGEVSG